jgi:hypothetical protein
MKTNLVVSQIGCILWVLLLFISSRSYGQIYTFSQSQSPYQELTDYKSLDLDYVYGSFDEAPLGFDFKVFGKTCSSVDVFKELVSFPFSFGSYSAVYPFFILNAELIDLNPQFPGSSQVNYTTMGVPGERIFVLEFKRAGIQHSSQDSDTLLGFISFQLRLYEKNGDIEVHYGTSYILEKFETSQIIGLYKNNFTEGIGVYGPTDKLRVTERQSWYPPNPVEGIPTAGTVYRFSYDKDLLWNNLPSSYSSNIGWNMINGISTNSGLLNTGTIAAELGGALLGHSKYKDLEFAEKYFLSEKAVIKGLVTQNYGAAHSNDSASFSIYSVAPNGLPGNMLQQKKKPYRCLNLDGKLNFIAFDNPVSIADSFFVAFGLDAYNKVDKDTIGLYFTTADSTVWQNPGFGRVATRWFNNQWYDVLSTKMLSNRTQVILISDQYGGLNDFINLAVFPVVNFNVENTTKIEENLDCRPLSLKMGYALEETFIEQNHLKLHPNFPNPASAYTYLNFTLKDPSPITIQVYNAEGKLVFEEKKTSVEAGFHQYYLNTESFGAGVYLYLVRSAYSLLSSKIVISR